MLPDVVIGLLKHTFKARVVLNGPGPKERHVVITGPHRFMRRLNIDDWNLISDNILFDPETDETLGAADPDSPPPPSSVTPYRRGSLLTVKGETPSNRRFNPRTPINRALLLRRDGSFKTVIIEQLKTLFP